MRYQLQARATGRKVAICLPTYLSADFGMHSNKEKRIPDDTIIHILRDLKNTTTTKTLLKSDIIFTIIFRRIDEKRVGICTNG